MQQGISAIILTKNEEQTFKRCLDSIKWCDEVIIVDDFSTDNTLEIAKTYNAKIIQHSLNNDFAQQRNFALTQAKNTWVFFVDADEEVTLSLQYEITNQINNQFLSFNGYYLKRVDCLWGKKLEFGELANVYILRLAKKDAGLWRNRVHEVWKIKGKTNKLSNVLFHYPHQNISDFLSEINHYTDLRSNELYQNNKRIYSWQIIVFPLLKFIYNYIFKMGFLDGVPGLIVAVMMSFHSYLVRSKGWIQYEKNKV